MERPMTVCPHCGHSNIDGADECDKCHSSLTPLSKPRPTSEIERSVMKDAVRDIVPREPVVVRPETPVAEVLRTLVQRNVGCAAVVHKHKVVGIFTDRDVLFRLNVNAGELAAHPVSEFMTSPVETLELDDRIAFALHKMDLGGYRHLPILLEGRVTGVLSVRDILDHITAAL
jgi:CBS domain-containing protein